jgi:hypothetical protein
MNRSILAGGLVTIAFVFVCSCSEDCVDSHPCKPETPQPIRILIAGAEVYPDCFNTISASLVGGDLLPAGSEVQSVQLTDSIPPLETVLQFDAVLLYTVGWPLDADMIGDVMADYADKGGGLVMCQWSMHFGSAEIRGRLKEPGYAPFEPGPIGDTIEDRSIDFDSVSFPLHPVFYGIDIRNIVFPGWYNIPHPALDETATLLAVDNFGANTVAINSDETIIGINTCPNMAFSPKDEYSNGAKLIANSLLFVAGASK